MCRILKRLIAKLNYVKLFEFNRDLYYIGV